MSKNFRKIIAKSGFILFIFIFVSLSSMIAQDYTFSLYQRRALDQIHVEIWAKSNIQNAPKIGYASLVVQFNNNMISPSLGQNSPITDSVKADVDQISPIEIINSPFHSQNGFAALSTTAYGTGYYSLEVNLGTLGVGGVSPSQTGRGTFVGKLIFDISGNPSDTSTTQILWSKSSLPGDTRVFAADSTDLENRITFNDVTTDFKVLGVTLLSLNETGKVVDRDKSYAALGTEYSGGGFPIYFERSVNPKVYKNISASPATIDDNIAYLLEYSTNNGATWIELGRVAENDIASPQAASNSALISGEIYNHNTATTQTITTQDGLKLTNANFRKPLRVIWATNSKFISRSESAKLRITQLNENKTVSIANRTKSTKSDDNNNIFTLGRLFFSQLNGTDEYFKSEFPMTNATQLTVEAWVNLNAINTGGEPAIVASSAGPGAAEFNGSNEGAWMLYLKDGNKPAFRAREIIGRGINGYMTDLYAKSTIEDKNTFEVLKAVSSAMPISDEHAKNWVHIAATINDNQSKLYLNGELIDEGTNISANDIRLLTTNHPIWIGVNPNDTIEATDYLNAGIKGVRVWKTALTQNQIRQRVGGISQPANISGESDLKSALMIYYDFESSRLDLASNIQQAGSNNAIFYKANVANNNAIEFRPDLPHIRLTSPVGNEGILNTANSVYQIRWLAYGFAGNDLSASSDVEFEYSIDSGRTWYLVRDSANTITAKDVESTFTTWSPYYNIDTNANLRTSSAPFTHNTLLRARGTVNNGQNTLSDQSQNFVVGRYLSLYSDGVMQIALDNAGMNISNNKAFIEAWVKPYRFPTSQEGLFPIISKSDSVTNDIYYDLSLLPNGQLMFRVKDSNGDIRTALSDSTKSLVAPNSIENEIAWYHIGVYFDSNPNGQSELKFYIDGNPQTDSTIVNQISGGFTIPSGNNYPLFLANSKVGVNDSATPNSFVKQTQGFVGEIREFRFWNGTPNGTSASGAEPTAMTKFIQGALAIYATDLKASNRVNLYDAISFNGSAFIHLGRNNSMPMSGRNENYLKVAIVKPRFVESLPYIKLVEPIFRQKVSSSATQLRVRWAGFSYDGLGFAAGSLSPKTRPSLEFSLLGGGGVEVQPYQYIGSTYYLGNRNNSLSFDNNDLYRFTGTDQEIVYAANLNPSIADPDINNDATYTDQGPLSATLTNARLRLAAKYSIAGVEHKLSSESALFSITPRSNFTVRVLLEGHHNGSVIATSNVMRNIGTSMENGGVKISLYEDLGGIRGAKVAEALSLQQYENLNPNARNNNANNFANINYIFTDLPDAKYWVMVEHINHLPVMSSHPANFKYTGDNTASWYIESGWDFQTWNGVDNNVLPNANAIPAQGGYFTAKGLAISTKTNPNYTFSGLIYNSGIAGLPTNALPAMVGGDINRDQIINAADRVIVRQDDGTTLVRSDITGDGFVNADDRTIVDRNHGKVSSLYNEFPTGGIVNPIGNNLTSKEQEIASQLEKTFANRIPIIDEKTAKTQAGGISYDVWAVAKLNNGYVRLNFYTKNKGVEFALANCTYAVNYDTTMLDYFGVDGGDSVIFTSNAAVGYYSALRSAPTANANEALKGVRTIEIDYDVNSNGGGVNVPYKDTYLGTLVFKMKNTKGVLSFTWFPTTSVHTTKGQVITSDGNFKDIDAILLYTAKVSSPNGGEKYSPSKNTNITWESTGDAPIIVQFSNNSGLTWSNLGNVNAKNLSLAWTTPNIISNTCLIRILDSASGKELDRSDAFFSIEQGNASISSPRTSNPVLTGGTNSAIIYSVKGYASVYFEFSENGQDNWIAIATNVDVSKTSVPFTVPKVTTKIARIRMIESETKIQIAISEPFRILSGSLQLKTPAAGDQLLVGTTTRIRWNSLNIKQFDLELSTDAGLTWEGIKQEQIASNGYLNWIVPNKQTNTAIIRALYDGDPDFVLSTTGIFTIWSKTDVEDFVKGFEISDFYPNPSSHQVNLSIDAEREDELSFAIYSESGELIGISEKTLNLGNNQIPFDISHLTSGVYFVIINLADKQMLRKFEIQK